MAEKLIVLSDGTGNSAAKLFRTNVWKVYQALDLSYKHQQIALYDDGVGTSKFKPLAILTGAFGYGLKRNVLNIYTFLSRHHAQGRNPEIYGFGFSRGAFTIRVVVGLIESQGLLPDADDEEMRRMAKLAYRAYRKERFHTSLHLEALFRKLRDSIVGTWHRLWGLKSYESVEKNKEVKIRFLGLWDTVNAYGVPIDELRQLIDAFIFPMTFASRKLPTCVVSARHALSIDDERSTFAPVPWDQDEELRLQQLWFCGSHSNVGGGYPDDTLASAPLAWIVDEAKKAGLKFRREALVRICSAVTPYGRLYDSRSGFGTFYRYKPRDIEYDTQKPDLPAVHESVVFRMATGFQGYAPVALPQQVRVSGRNGETHQFEGFQNDLKEAMAPDHYGIAPATLAPADHHALPLADLVAKLKAPDKDTVDLIRAAILQRRIVYFGTVAPLLFLLFFPLEEAFRADEFGSPGESWITAFLEAPLEALKAITPSYFSPWPESFVRWPGFVWVLSALALGSYLWGKKLKTRIAYRARAAWNMGAASQTKPTQNFGDKLAIGIMRSDVAHAGWTFLQYQAVPWGLLIVFFLTALVLIDRGAFSVRAALGFVCSSKTEPEALIKVSPAGSEVKFDAGDPCRPTGLHLQQGQTYLITMQPSQQADSSPMGSVNAPWTDRGNEADLAGVNLAKLSWRDSIIMNLSVPFRRHFWSEWFHPIARIGEQGNDEYPLSPQVPFQTRQEAQEMMVSRIKARSSGELFLFVNDAYSGALPIAWLIGVGGMNRDGSSFHTYGNNTGVVIVKVERDRPRQQ